MPRTQVHRIRSAESPFDVVHVERVGGGDVDIVQGRTVRSFAPDADFEEVFEKLVVSPRVARGIRDALTEMNLDDE